MNGFRTSKSRSFSYINRGSSCVSQVSQEVNDGNENAPETAAQVLKFFEELHEDYDNVIPSPKLSRSPWSSSFSSDSIISVATVMEPEPERRASQELRDGISFMNNMADELRGNKMFCKTCKTESAGEKKVQAPRTAEVKTTTNVTEEEIPRRKTFVALPRKLSISKSQNKLEVPEPVFYLTTAPPSPMPTPPVSPDPSLENDKPSYAPTNLIPDLPPQHTKPSFRKKPPPTVLPSDALPKIPEDSQPKPTPRPAVPRRNVALPTVITRDLAPVSHVLNHLCCNYH